MQPISTALLSFGMSGKLFHAPFIQANPGFLLSTVWERSQQLAQEIYPTIQTVRSLDEILQNPSIELVVINTPTATHFEYARQVLLAGKHIIVEKAFTTTVEEAQELCRLAKEQKLCISVFQNRRWDSDFQTVRRILHSGELGEIMEAEFHYDRFKEELSPKLHKETPQLGAGIVYDLGPHVIDQALTCFGFPQQVFADIRITRAGSRVDDYFEIVLYYPNLRVRLKSGYYYRETIPAFTLFGKKGSFLKSRADVQEVDLLASVPLNSSKWGIEPESEQGLLHTERNGTVIREKAVTEKGNYGAYYENIWQHIRKNATLEVTGEDGIRVMKIIEAAYLSNKERKVVDVS
ncbi:MAG: oxidoreductase [Sediminibacterium sp.]|nr:oxidoreductase [Sediminibacterium sp.]